MTHSLCYKCCGSSTLPHTSLQIHIIYLRICLSVCSSVVLLNQRPVRSLTLRNPVSCLVFLKGGRRGKVRAGKRRKLSFDFRKWRNWLTMVTRRFFPLIQFSSLFFSSRICFFVRLPGLSTAQCFASVAVSYLNFCYKTLNHYIRVPVFSTPSQILKSPSL